MNHLLSPALLLAASLACAAPIFDGKTLDGWEGDPKWWRVADGVIEGGSRTEKVPHNYFLATTKTYQNFDLRLKLKLTGDPKTGFINSGVQIRSVRVPNNTEMSGYQVDAGDGWWGKLYDESRRNKVIGQAANLAAVTAAVKKDDWNEIRIRSEGSRIQSWINGVAALDYTETDTNVAQDGRIAVQIHSGGLAIVQVKDVTIEELPPTPNAPTWEKVGKPGEKKKSAALKEGNADAGPRTPEEERATFKLPDGFEAELVAAESDGIGKFVPIAFDQRGALWTTTALEYPVDGNENPAAADALYKSHAKDKVLVFDRDPQSPTGLSSKPRVFADGLAIPLGVLPYKSGCYVQHGHDIVFLEDTNADGKADKRTVILTGFGVQDSHLFPHQFLRAPGGWIWMAQGAFNYSKVRQPGEPAEKAVKFDQTRMAKFRPDGSDFTITSNGPCNIWGLVLNGEGEAFIQEANDLGYPVMPFHEFANYPGCSDSQWKSYAPEFPGTAPDFRMGGTGLSGLALLDEGWAKLLEGEGDQSKSKRVASPITDHRSPTPSSQTVLIANPITNRIQSIKMHRDGPYWKLDKPTDFLVSSDPWFRPVAITIGPDGCLYIVDWYNKIISHNEVPRNHPDRDKTRGRIWRVKSKTAKPFDVPDFTKLSGDELIAKLGGESLAQHHLAWQALADRKVGGVYGSKAGQKIWDLIEAGDQHTSAARAIGALWVMDEGLLAEVLNDGDSLNAESHFRNLLKSTNRNCQREAVRALAPHLRYVRGGVAHGLLWELIESNKLTSELRAEVIRAFGTALGYRDRETNDEMLATLIKLVSASLNEPMGKSTQSGKPIKVREAYDREFERYLVRMFLEQHPNAVAKFLDSDAAKPLPVEARLLASLALEPKASAARVAKLLPQLERAPGQEEVLRLAQFPDEPGVGEALRAILSNPQTRAASLDALLAVRTKLDAAKLAPLLGDAAAALLASDDAASNELGVQLAAGFKLASAEPALVALLSRVGWGSRPPVQASPPERSFENRESPVPLERPRRETRRSAGETPTLPGIIRTLAEIGSRQTELFAKVAESAAEPALRDEALAALAGSKAADAPPRALALYPKLAPAQRRVALDKLSTTKAGAGAIVAAVGTGTLPKRDLDAAALDRLLAVLGEDDPALAKLLGEMSAFFRPVLMLDGSEEAWSETGLTLDGPFTVETWVRLDPDKRKIGNADGILGAPGQLDINFHDGKLRVWVGDGLHDVAIAKKPVTPGMWTHVAATRDATGNWKLYLDGELDATGTKPAGHKIENARIAWSGAPDGTRGALAEYRIWNRERTASEMRGTFDRSVIKGPLWAFDGNHANNETHASPDSHSSQLKLHSGARIAKTADLPPVLTADQAAQLDAKFAKYTALAAQPGDIERGKQAALVCAACHLFGTTGGNIGPNLSGVGAMGVEAILRNILTPNAAMESAYRIYRVEQRDGSVLDAFFVSEDKDAVVIRLPGAADQRIAKKDIVRTQFLRRSLMPEGLLDALPDEQVRDLFSYLKSLK